MEMEKLTKEFLFLKDGKIIEYREEEGERRAEEYYLKLFPLLSES